jgi:hypothetical protein
MAGHARARAKVAIRVVGCFGAVALGLVSAVAGAAGAAGAAAACAPGEGVDSPLPVAANVRDPVFAVLVGLLNANRFGCISAEALEGEVRRLGRPTPLPYRRVRSILRRPATAAGDARVTIELDGALRLPIPYRILFFYRPGDIWSDGVLDATEWHLGTMGLTLPDGSQSRLDEVHLFRLDSGRAGVDIDGWLDRLLGARLDDMNVDGFATFEHAGRSWGLAVGRNPSGSARLGLFDFTGDKIAFPTPKAIKPLARQLRLTLESLSQQR